MSRLTPALKQAVGTLRGDGSASLPAAPTVGNLMILAIAGWGSNMGAGATGVYIPSGGWHLCALYLNDINNGVAVWQRRVQTGDTGVVALSAPDNHAAVLYEYENAAACYPLTGGSMSRFFSGNNFTMPVVRSPFGLNDQILCVLEHDTTPTWIITAETGVVSDYTTPASALNHTGAFARSLPNHSSRQISGSLSGTPVSPVYGQFAVVGEIQTV